MSYKELLNIYYSTNPRQKCDQCGKIGSYIKSVNKSTDNLILKCDSCKWEVSIKKNKNINMKQHYIDLNNDKKNLIYKLNEAVKKNDEKLFLEIKKNFIKKMKEIDDNNKIHQQYFMKEKQIEIKKEIFELHKKLNELYYKRGVQYNNIDLTKINKQIRDKFIEIYKNEKKIGDSRFIQLQKQFNVPLVEVKKWFNWFKLSSEYIKLDNELKNKLTMFDTINKEYHNKLINFYLQESNVTIINKAIKKVGKNVDFSDKKTIKIYFKKPRKRKKSTKKVLSSGKK